MVLLVKAEAQNMASEVILDHVKLTVNTNYGELKASKVWKDLQKSQK